MGIFLGSIEETIALRNFLISDVLEYHIIT